MTITRIQHSRITGTGGVPLASQLAVGELFLNLTDASIFSKEGSTVLSLVPKGIIVDWFGNAASVPNGWAICDGTNGTPDLRARLTYGASVDGDVGATGGATTPTSSSDGDHNHGGSSGSHAVTTSQMPSHSHFVFLNSAGTDTAPSLTGTQAARKTNDSSDNNKYIMEGAAATPSVGITNTQGSGSSHSHTISSPGDHSHTASILPPYHRLHKIMKL